MHPDNVNSKADFIAFIESLVQDLKMNRSEWENKNLEDYLVAIASWTDDMEGYYINTNQPVPENVPWKIFADILIAAKMYE